MKGATEGECPVVVLDKVSIHAPMKGATKTINGLRYLAQFQSTHP